MKWKDDSKAFIFTLKNARGVPPTRYMKREGSRYAIGCYSYLGPVFGDSDIFLVSIYSHMISGCLHVLQI